VWGEIDHKLKYKREKDATPEEEAKAANPLAHLNVMKTMIDGLAQYGDQIKIQMDEPSENRLRSIKSKLAEEPMERLCDLGPIPADMMEKIEATIGLARFVFEANNDDDVSFADQVSTHRRAMEELHSLREAVHAANALSDTQRSEVLYALDMERALLLFDYGNSLQGSAGNEALVESSRIYTELEPRFPERGIIKYRMGKVLDALGDRRAAMDKLTELLSEMDKTDLPATHWVRAAAPRSLGVMYWERALDLIARGKTTSEEAWRQEVLSCLAQAYRTTKLVVGADAEIDASFGAVLDAPERRKILNNLLFFAVELVSFVEDRDIADASYKKGDLQRLLAQVEALTDVPELDFRHAHTLMRANQLAGTHSAAVAAAERVDTALVRKGVVDRGGSSREEVMLREARRVLAEDSPAELSSAEPPAK
jgi:hypothetical protein